MMRLFELLLMYGAWNHDDCRVNRDDKYPTNSIFKFIQTVRVHQWNRNEHSSYIEIGMSNFVN